MFDRLTSLFDNSLYEVVIEDNLYNLRLGVELSEDGKYF